MKLSIEAKLLRTVERWNLILGAALVVLSVVVRPRLPVVLGVALGATIACINFSLLRRIVERITAAKSKGLLLSVLFIKMAGLMVAVWLILKYLPVNVIAFTIGLSTFLISFFVATVKITVAQAAEATRKDDETHSQENLVN